MANDVDIEHDTLTAILVSNATHGNVILNADGSFSYTPTANYSGSDSFSYKVNDGHDDSNVATVSLLVNAVNDPPVNSVPAAQSVNEDTTLVFSTAGGNAISINDVDAGSSVVQVTLNGSHGLLSLAATTGLTFSTGDGSADATMTFTGTIANINAALDGLNFSPTANYNGAASLQIITNDQGNSGAGGVRATPIR